MNKHEATIECEHGVVVLWGDGEQGRTATATCLDCERDLAEAWQPLRLPDLDLTPDDDFVAILDDLLDFCRWLRLMAPKEFLEEAAEEIHQVRVNLEKTIELQRSAAPCADCYEVRCHGGPHAKCEKCLNEHRLSIGLAPYFPAHKLRGRRANLSEHEVQRAVNATGGKCEVCTALLVDGYVVDHNHKTGEFRGILCTRCNTGLGHFGDDPAWLEAAADYLLERGHYGGDA